MAADSELLFPFRPATVGSAELRAEHPTERVKSIRYASFQKPIKTNKTYKKQEFLQIKTCFSLSVLVFICF